MKIVNIETFLKMPEGTIYTKYQSFGMVNGFYLKGESIGDIDWWYMDLLLSTEAKDSDEFFGLMDKAEYGKEFPVAYHTHSRDGLYEEEQMFLIYSEEDIKKLVDVLSDTTKIIKEDK